jgi:hypothetical protein
VPGGLPAVQAHVANVQLVEVKLFLAMTTHEAVLAQLHALLSLEWRWRGAVSFKPQPLYLATHLLRG